jgi:prepilin-type N-terminal cleavage/methylation domain-containing protein
MRPGAGSVPLRPGFTMMEMIIVVIVLGLLATAIVPRMTGTDARRARIALEATEDLLTVLAHRSSVSFHPVGLQYDGEANVLRIMTLQIDPRTERGVWQPDDLADEVRYPDDVRVQKCYVDDEPQAYGSWLVEFPVQEVRPVLRLRLAGPKLDVFCVLASHASTSRTVPAGGQMEEESPLVDLDAEGREFDPW